MRKNLLLSIFAVCAALVTVGCDRKSGAPMSDGQKEPGGIAASASAASNASSAP